MCHPGFPSFDGGEKTEQTRWFMLQVAAMVQAMNLPGAIDRRGDGVIGVGGHGGVAGLISKQCLCSPTKHPGSFRCRQHHSEYQWGRRL
ncbi:hypothetical protein AQUCO_00100507v1 [Aquilegia coerulea]|uniref:Uncharacterized protein n=1 Tax=Aquilegia coerulea TaxID=218851 RepID=A0A2G5FAQ2_AQUCA|nr:hypothetical protein AQUCO_00100507v1 [Aquilegia coerulea]